MFPVAPNPTKVRLYLAEKALAGCEIPLEQVVVNLPAGEQRQAEHLARNPRGKLPVLELDDGSYLTESLAIIEYLEECFPESPMIGREPVERARMRELERFTDIGGLMAIARVVHATNSPLQLPPIPEVAENAREAARTTFSILEATLADGRPFLAGERPSIADCTLAAGLQFARFREIDLGLEADFPNLSAWDHAYRERESAKSVLVI
jgi:glutathione S-transferase